MATESWLKSSSDALETGGLSNLLSMLAGHCWLSKTLSGKIDLKDSNLPYIYLKLIYEINYIIHKMI